VITGETDRKILQACIETICQHFAMYIKSYRDIVESFDYIAVMLCENVTVCNAVNIISKNGTVMPVMLYSEE
jgi:hypothetical protein